MGSNISLLETAKKAMADKESLRPYPKERMRLYFDYITNACTDLKIDQTELVKRFPDFEADVRLHPSEVLKTRTSHKNERRESKSSKVLNGLRAIASTVLFSNDEFYSKLNLLFRAYDFNLLHSISAVDVEMMVFSCMLAALRGMGSASEPVATDLDKFVSDAISHSGRIRLIDLMRGFSNCGDVNKFCLILSIKQPIVQEIDNIDEIYKYEDVHKEMPPGFRPETRRPQFVHQSSARLLDELSRNPDRNPLTALQVVIDKKLTSLYSVRNLKLKMQWVYGFDGKESFQIFIYHQSPTANPEKFVSDAKVIYFVSNVVVLYYYKINKQKHYREHQNRVCSIALSKNGELCATGDVGDLPEIHVWSPKDLRTRRVISGTRGLELYLLQFISSDQYLVAASSTHNTPITIFDLSSGQRLVNFGLQGFARNLGSFIDTTSSFHISDPELEVFRSFNILKSFYILTQCRIYLVLFQTALQQYQLKMIGADTLKLGEATISCCCSAIIHPDKPFITFFDSRDKFDIFQFYGLSDGRLMFMQFPVNEDENWDVTQVMQFRQSVNHILYYKAPFFLVQVGTEFIHLVNMMSGLIIYSIDLNSLPFRFEESKMVVKSFTLGKASSIIVATTDGEMFRVSLKGFHLWDSQVPEKRLRASKFDQIFRIVEPLKAMCLVENAKEGLILTGGINGIIYALSSRSRLLVRKTKVFGEITALDCMSCSNGDFVIAVGTVMGCVNIITNWAISQQHFDFGKKINFLKFSPKGSFLIAGCCNNSMYRFTFTVDSFCKTALRMVSFDSENPISLNFCLDFNIGVVETDGFHFYKIDISKFERAEVIVKGSGQSIPRMYFRNAQSNKNESIPTIFDQELGFVITGHAQGSLIAYETVYKLADNAGSPYFGHTGPVQEMAVNCELDQLFSIDKNNGSVICWKLQMDIHEGSLSNKNACFNPTESRTIASDNNEARCRLVQARSNFIQSSIGYFKGALDRAIPTRPPNQPSRRSHLSLPKVSIKIKHVFGFETSFCKSSILYIHSKRMKSRRMLEFRMNSSFSDQNNSQNMREEVESDCPSPRQTTVFTPNRVSGPGQKDLVNGHQKLLQVDYVASESLPRGPGPSLSPSPCRKRTTSNSPLPVHNLQSNYSDKEELIEDNEFDQFINSNGVAKKSQQGQSECSRMVVYFVSRLAIVADAEKLSSYINWSEDSSHVKWQRLYQGHQAPISILAVHHSNMIVATGEAASSPSIHLWNPSTCSTFTVIKTEHILAIRTLTFTHSMPFLISTSPGKESSIQVTDWIQNRLIAFRNVSDHEIIDLIANNTDSYIFYTSSQSEICQWSISVSSIFLKKSFSIQNIDPTDCFNSLSFLAYPMNGRLQKDLIALTKKGKFAVVRGSSDVLSVDADLPHCSLMKIFILRGKPYFFVAADDVVLRIYGIDFTFKVALDVRSHLPAADLSCCITSFDMCQCGESDEKVLLGLNSGDIIELSIKKYIDTLEGDNKIINFKTFHLENHPSVEFSGSTGRKKVLISAHQKDSLLASVGGDNIIRLWDIASNRLVCSHKLEHSAMIIRFLPIDRILMISFADGSMNAVQFVPRSHSDKVFRARNQSAFYDSRETSVLSKDLMAPSGIACDVRKQEKVLVAVSYTNDSNQQFITHESRNPKVKIFEVSVRKPSGNEVRLDDGSFKESHFLSVYYEQTITLPIYEEVSDSNGWWTRAVTDMSFTKDGRYLYMSSQMIDSQLEKDTRQIEKTSIIYDIEHKNIVGDICNIDQFELTDPKSGIQIHGRDFPIIRKENFEVELLASNSKEKFLEVGLSVFVENNDVYIIGSSTGSLYVVRVAGITHTFEQRPDEKNDKICINGDGSLTDSKEKDEWLRLSKKEELAQSQRFAGHCTQVSQIELSSCRNFAFTTSIGDGCVIKWRIDSNYSGGGENEEVEFVQPDELLHEVSSIERFKSLQKLIYPLRQALASDFNEIDKAVKPAYLLEKFKIFGRKSHNGRSNLYFTINNKFIYISGSSLVILDLFEKKSYKQNCLTTTVGSRFVVSNLGKAIEPELALKKESYFSTVKRNSDGQIRRGSFRNSDRIVEEKEIEDDSNDEAPIKHKASLMPQKNQVGTNQHARSNKDLQALLRSKAINVRTDSLSSHPLIGSESRKSRVGTNGERNSMLLPVSQKNANSKEQEGRDASDIPMHGFTRAVKNIKNEMNINSNENDKIPIYGKSDINSGLSDIKSPIAKAGTIKGLIKDLRESLINIPDDEETPTVEKIVNSEIKQTFFSPSTNEAFFAPPEVALMEIAPDRMTACIATNGLKATLSFWDVNSWVQQSIMTIELCQEVLVLRFSDNSARLICIGVSPSYSACIYLIDVSKAQIIAFVEFCSTVSFILKDASFLPGKPDKFVTVGLDHLSCWQFKGESLHFKNLQRGLQTLKTKESKVVLKRDLTKSFQSFDTPSEIDRNILVITFLQRKVFITASSLGSIYVWRRKTIIQAYTMLAGLPITVILKVNSSEVYIGGFGPRIENIEFGHDFSISKRTAYEVPLTIDQNAKLDPQIQIQSLALSPDNDLVVGTRTGSICIIKTSLSISDSGEIVFQLDFSDFMVPKAVEFSSDSQFVYVVTEDGLFSAYSISNMQLVYQSHFENRASDILVVNSLVLLVFEKEVVVLDDQKNFEKAKTFCISRDMVITKVRISIEQNQLFLVMTSPNEKGSKIEVYDLQTESFALCHTWHTDEVRLLDFSLDGNYLMIQTAIREIRIYEMKGNFLPIEAPFLHKIPDIDWSGEGLLVSPLCSFMQSFFDKRYKITSVVRLSETCVAVGEDSGSVD